MSLIWYPFQQTCFSAAGIALVLPGQRFIIIYRHHVWNWHYHPVNIHHTLGSIQNSTQHLYCSHKEACIVSFVSPTIEVTKAEQGEVIYLEKKYGIINSYLHSHPQTVTKSMAVLPAIHIALWLLAAIHIALWLPVDIHIALWLPVATLYGLYCTQ